MRTNLVDITRQENKVDNIHHQSTGEISKVIQKLSSYRTRENQIAPDKLYFFLLMYVCVNPNNDYYHFSLNTSLENVIFIKHFGYADIQTFRIVQ